MSDQLDSKMRELTYRLMAMAPEAPPFPEEPLVQIDPSPTPGDSTPWRGYFLGMAAAAAVVLVLVGVPMLFLRGDTAPDSALPAATQPPVFVSTTTIPSVSSTSDPEVTTTAALEPTAGTCSASDLNEPLVAQPELPPAVAATRQAIYEAATACNIPALVALAGGGSHDFNASFGGDEPGPFWTEREAAGVPVLADLIRHLNLAFVAPQGEPGDLQVYVWPFASSLRSLDEAQIPAADLAALLELYPIEELRQQFEIVGGYVGWRTGIAADGEWLFFVEGD